MSQIINLRTVRKQAARDQKRKRATAQAAKHGRSAAGKRLEQARAEQARAHLDGHKLDGHEREE
ncbi:MAG: DUF4169 family protein [Natronohydrobacter sp.]|nr:DUF4169 family protein [Natronohydrobacter sp.]